MAHHHETGIVDPDILRAESGDYTTAPEEFRAMTLQAWAEAVRGKSTAVIMVGAPASGKSTAARSYAGPGVAVLDACNTWKPSRKQAQRIAEQAGARVMTVYMATNLDECLRRNDSRARRVDPGEIRRQCELLARDPPRADVVL